MHMILGQQSWRMVLLLACCVQMNSSARADLQADLSRIKATGAEGAGNKDAQVAWKTVVGAGVDALLPIIAAMDDARPVPSNMLRLAAQAIVEKEIQASRSLPTDKLEAFVKDTKHAPLSRRLAYEFLVQADAKTPARLLPGMIDDPSVEIRLDAIAASLQKLTPAFIKSEPEAAKKQLEQLFAASRDKDQTEKIAKMLKDLKIETDLNKHFGVITDWMLVGPFDSTKGAGYDKPFDPEIKVDLSAAFKGKDGKDVKWTPHTTTEAFGLVDLNATLGKHKDATAYAFTIIDSPKEMPIDIRFGSQTAVKVFLNGKEIYAREEYHHGFRFDQYIGTGTLKAGRNELLLKTCQNNQTEGWAQDWKFQVRVCDFTGGAVPVRIVTKK